MSKKNRCAFEFYNCDADRTHSSMNPIYEKNVYRDTRDSRRKLWKRIKTECEMKNIAIKDSDMSQVRFNIMNGSPVDANKYMTYGVILQKNMMD